MRPISCLNSTKPSKMKHLLCFITALCCWVVATSQTSSPSLEYYQLSLFEKFQEKDWGMAGFYCQMALSELERLGMKDTPDYVEMLNTYALVTMLDGHTEEAITRYSQLADAYAALGSEYDEQQADALVSLADLLIDVQEPEQAIAKLELAISLAPKDSETAQEAEELLKAIRTDSLNGNGHAISNQATLDAALQNKKSLEQAGLKSTDEYAKNLALIAETYSLMGNHVKCLDYLDSCLMIPNTSAAFKRDIRYAKAQHLTSLGQYQSSVMEMNPLLSQVDYANPALIDYNLLLAHNYLCLADLALNDPYADKKQADAYVEQMREYANKAFDLSSALKGDGAPLSIYAKMYLCALDYLLHDKTTLLNDTNDCEQLIRANAQGSANDMLQGLAIFYAYAGDTDKAMALIEETTQDSLPSDMLIINEAPLEAKAYINMQAGNSAEAQRAITEAAHAVMDQIGNQMMMLGQDERNSYWRTFQQTLNNAPAYATDQSSEFTGELYDMALFSKMLLFDSDLRFRKAIAAMDSPQLTELYEAIKQTRNEAINDSELSAADRKELLNMANEAELELLRHLPASDIEKPAKWQEVQKALPTHGIAIEFLQYQDLDQVPQYAALVLCPDDSYPRFVKLGASKDLERGLRRQWFDHVNELLWDPLQSYLESAQVVYFAPAGILNRIPIEATPKDGRRYCRLSSSRQLLRQPKMAAVHSAAIFGGMDFDLGASTDAGLNRYQLANLPGSLREAQTVDSLLIANQQETSLFTKEQATENNFRSALSANPSMLHVSTHGYFAPDRNSSLSTLLDFNPTNEDTSLSQNGLYFSGANIASDRLNDDGVVTALDISAMDLTNAGLVTLSACQSGRGEITQDGVVGLQRGFKKAGAGVLLMSLWNVNDSTTEQLMTTFYSRLLAGATPHAALEAAQTVLRSDGSHSDPTFWAPFILIDSLE